MKKTAALIVAILISIVSQTVAQTMRDVVYLKNGSVIKGAITEQYPDSVLKIKLTDGSIMVYKTNEIEKMLREEITSEAKPTPNLKEYGGHFGLGIAIGGGGILGVPLRINFSNMISMEAGVFLRPSYYYTKTTTIVYNQNGEPIYSSEKEEHEFKVPPMIAGGFNFFFGENYNPRAGKIVRNGIAIKAGHTIIPDYTENMFALGWARERFKENRKHQSYLMELGLGILTYGNGNSPLGDAIDEDLPIMPFIYYKFHWNWYVVK